MAITLPQTRVISAGSTRIVRINCTKDLEGGASLAGAPTVTEVGTADLTIANKAITTATYVDDCTRATVAIGKAIEFTVAGGAAGETYLILCTCATDSTPAETLEYQATVKFE